MDSKKKFAKNRYWKKKYQPRNGVAHVSRLSIKSTPQDGNQSDDELEGDLALKQPVPKDGWFPESDPEESSDPDDFSSLANITGNKKQSEKNWFDKELDNVQVTPEVPNNTKDVNDEKDKLKSVPSSKITSGILKKVMNDEKSSYNADNEEKELDFLLSLKEPVYTGPTLTKKDLESKINVTCRNTNRTEQKPIKTIDLEKWLDSVLDD